MMIVNTAHKLGEMSLNLTQRHRRHSQKYDQEYGPVKVANDFCAESALPDPALESLKPMIKTLTCASSSDRSGARSERLGGFPPPDSRWVAYRSPALALVAFQSAGHALSR